MKKIELKQINKILLAFFLILLTWFLWDLFINVGERTTVVDVETISGESSEEETRQSSKSQDFKYYANYISKRDLFRATVFQKEVSTKREPTPVITISDFRLLGIASGTRPQAIIKNEKTKKTYFLYKGQSQDNLKVEDITGNGVKLNFRGEIFELFL